MPRFILVWLNELNVFHVWESTLDRDGNGTGFFGYPPRPSLMGWGLNLINGFGAGMGFFFKPGVDSGIAPPCPY